MKEVDEVQTKLKMALDSIESAKELNETYLERFKTCSLSIDPSRKTHKQSKKAKKEQRNIRQKLENTEDIYFTHSEEDTSSPLTPCP